MVAEIMNFTKVTCPIIKPTNIVKLPSVIPNYLKIPSLKNDFKFLMASKVIIS